MSAMDTANFWIEYVVRHGPEILKSPALELAWWELELLDVYVFIILVIIGALLIVYRISKILLSLAQHTLYVDAKDLNKKLQ